MENVPQNLTYYTIIFHYVVPSNEFIGESPYLEALENTLQAVLQFGSVQPAILGMALEQTIDGFNFDIGENVNVLHSKYDEVYSELYSFVEETLFSEINKPGLSSLMLCYGVAETISVTSGFGLTTALILLNNNSIQYLKQPNQN